MTKTEWIFISIAILILGGLFFLLSKIPQEARKAAQHRNEIIIDCQNRGNQLQWCLDSFNK